MVQSNVFKGKFNYYYKKTGNNENQFKTVYDTQNRSVDCILKLPNENDKCVIEMEFETPDGKYKDFVSIDLKVIVMHGSDLFCIGLSLMNHEIINGIALIQGDLILEIKLEHDAWHTFNFSIEIENPEVIQLIENHKLMYESFN